MNERWATESHRLTERSDVVSETNTNGRKTNTMSLLPLETYVGLKDFNNGDRGYLNKGTIVGYSFMQDCEGDIHNLYLMRLENGFYNPEKNIFVSVLAVHVDSVEPIA